MSIDNCQVCDKRLDTDFVEYQDDGTLLCDGCLDELENEQESDKVYVKTDGPCPEYLTAGKVYEVRDLDMVPRDTRGLGTLVDDQGVEIVALIGLPTSHLYGGMWAICDQYGNPLAEQQVTDWKALAGELAEALATLMAAETNETWRYPTVLGPIVRKAKAALAKYDCSVREQQEQEKGGESDGQ